VIEEQMKLKLRYCQRECDYWWWNQKQNNV